MLGYSHEAMVGEYQATYAEPVDIHAIRSTSLRDASDLLVLMELAERFGYDYTQIAEAYGNLAGQPGPEEYGC